MSLQVEVQFALDDAALPDAAQLGDWARAAFVAAGEGGDAQLTLRVVDTAEISALNRDFRHRDAPTNVLSFPFEAPAGLPAGVLDAELGRTLGDVVICAAVVRREAAEQGKAERDHWAHMVVHGTLHLLGHDHIDDAEAERMESLEIRTLAGLGIANPYQFPVSAHTG